MKITKLFTAHTFQNKNNKKNFFETPVKPKKCNKQKKTSTSLTIHKDERKTHCTLLLTTLVYR